VCFVWPYEAETVFLSSDHDNWKSLTPLIKTEENANWHCILKIPAHKRIHFRFYVDSVMRCDPKLRVVVGKDGGYVNQLVIRPNHLESFFEQRKKRKTPKYFRQIPSLLALQEKLKKCEPPPEAPRHFTTKPEDRSFSSALFNHVFSSNIKDDGVVCLSMNQQIHQKRVLTVYYKPSPHTKSEHSPRKNSSDPIKPVRCASNVSFHFFFQTIFLKLLRFEQQNTFSHIQGEINRIIFLFSPKNV